MPRRLAATILAFLIAAPGFAQCSGTTGVTFHPNLNYSSGESYDSTSAEAQAPGDPANIHVVDSQITGAISGPGMGPGGSTPLFTPDSLGLSTWTSLLPPGSIDIDAVSNAEGVFPAAGIASACNTVGIEVAVEFTVTRLPGVPGLQNTLGGPYDPAPGAAVISNEYDPGGNGAASDVFVARVEDAFRHDIFQRSDHLGVTERVSFSSPGDETNKDALTDARRLDYPIWFSVDRSSALALTWAGFPCTGGDVLWCEAQGQPAAVWASHCEIGLSSEDDIDGLELDYLRHGSTVSADREFLFSLDRESPSTYLAIPPSGSSCPQGGFDGRAVGAGGIFIWDEQLGIIDWAYPENLGLARNDGANPDTGGDVNGFWIHDPPGFAAGSANGLGEGGYNEPGPGQPKLPGAAVAWATILVDGDDGGPDRKLLIEPAREPSFSILSPDVDYDLDQMSDACDFLIYVRPNAEFATTPPHEPLAGLGQPYYVDPSDTGAFVLTHSNNLGSPIILTNGSQRTPWSTQIPDPGPVAARASLIIQGVLVHPANGEIWYTNAIEVVYGVVDSGLVAP